MHRYMQREAQLIYIARQKVQGVPHHAKAGNINSALLKESPGHGEYILVLDCDMIIHPDFLMRVLGHFYRWAPADQAEWFGPLDDTGLPVGLLDDSDDGVGIHAAPQGRWVLKEKAAFIQTPQVSDYCVLLATMPLSCIISTSFQLGLQECSIGKTTIACCTTPVCNRLGCGGMHLKAMSCARQQYTTCKVVCFNVPLCRTSGMYQLRTRSCTLPASSTVLCCRAEMALAPVPAAALVLYSGAKPHPVAGSAEWCCLCHDLPATCQSPGDAIQDAAC